MMDESITWLHISDTHFCFQKGGYEARNILSELVEDLQIMEEKEGLCPDFIFYTGDIAYGNIGESLEDQYDSAQEFINQIRTSFSREVPIKMVFLVPGNHDVDRKKITDIDKEGFKIVYKTLDSINNLI